MLEKVEVVNYNGQWVSLFDAESRLVKQVLGVNCLDVHHVGSTSVPGLAAKPIVDMIVVVDRIVAVDLANSQMESIEYQPKGEFGIAFRRYFKKRTVDCGFNVHVYEKGNQEIDRHLLFKNWLVEHPDDRDEYEQLKKKLADQYPNDVNSYTKRKSELIAKIQEKTGFCGIRFNLVFSKSEWEDYHRLRKEQIFSKFDHIVYDPNHPSMFQSNSFNFGLFKGNQMMTAIFVELLDEDRAAIRTLATDNGQQGKGYGRLAMNFTEKWIKQQGRRLIQLHSMVSAQKFYRKLGYDDMTFENDCCISSDCVDMGKMLDTVKIVKSDPQWPALFEDEQRKVRSALGDNCLAIHHIGSTSVPDLAAEPVIDMMSVVKDILDIDRINSSINQLGYQNNGEFGLPLHRVFLKKSLEISFKIYILEKGSPEVERYLKFRDWIKSNSKDKNAYEQLKFSLATTFIDDHANYWKKKSELISEIIARAAPDCLSLRHPLTDEELKQFLRIRKQIYDRYQIPYDHNTPNLHKPNYFNFILLKGAEVISIARIHLIDEETAVLRALSTEEQYHRKGYGKYLLGMVERWAKHRNKSVIKLHAAIEAEQFYRKLGYDNVDLKEEDMTEEERRSVIDLGKELR